MIAGASVVGVAVRIYLSGQMVKQPLLTVIHFVYIKVREGERVRAVY